MKSACFLLLLLLISSLLVHFLPFVSSTTSPPPSSSNSLRKFLKCFETSDAAVVFTRSHPSFQSILQAHVLNLRFNRSSTPKPVAIVTALTYSHVQSTIVCAKSSKLRVRIRSGGHDYEGMSYVSEEPFVILDMFKLRKISVDVEKEIVRVESGAIIGELYYDVATKSNHTLAVPGGVCFTVGVGGHFSGGGYGNLIRKYGLTVDQIIDAQVVDVNGRILNRKTMGEDLFWAIRGGGGASFCVVLSWTMKLVRVPQTLTVFAVRRTLDEGATNIVDQWQQVGHKLDPNLFIRVQPQAFQQSSGKMSLAVTFIAMYLGRAESLIPLVNKQIPLLGLQRNDVIEMTWAQSILYWYISSPKGTPIELMLNRTITPNYFKNKSDFVKKPVPKKGWEAIWKKMIELGPNVLLQFNPYGGKMDQIPEDATPFPHRAGNLFKMQYITSWDDDELEVEEVRVKGIRELHDLFTPYVSQNPREAFLNYRDIDIGTNANQSIGFALDFFKNNVKRLLHVKAKVDPHNFFKYEQSIPLIKGY